jgi:hypothetical protein
VWRGAGNAANASGATTAASAAAVAAYAPHAPPSWMTKKWPPMPPGYPTNPPAPPVRDLAFLALADWGGQTDWPMTTAAQLQCAPAMATVAKQLQVSMIVSGGDNFYDSGIPGAPRAAALVLRDARGS